jgi:hypothetical protein
MLAPSKAGPRPPVAERLATVIFSAPATTVLQLPLWRRAWAVCLTSRLPRLDCGAIDESTSPRCRRALRRGFFIAHRRGTPELGEPAGPRTARWAAVERCPGGACGCRPGQGGEDRVTLLALRSRPREAGHISDRARPGRRRQAPNTPPIAGEAPVEERSQHHIYPPLARPWFAVARPAATSTQSKHGENWMSRTNDRVRRLQAACATTAR